MAYVGKQPVRGQNRELDDISGSFNGSTTAFTMQVGGVNTSAGSVNQLFISVGGVMQNPGTDFTAAASTLTFTTAPPDGASFWGLIQGDSININTPADDSVTGAKLAVSLVAGDTLYASGTDTLARLAKGTDGQVLKLASGLPSWSTDSSGLNSDAQANTVGGTSAGADFSGTSAIDNTLLGYETGKGITSADYNTAVGRAALQGDGSTAVTGGENVAIGRSALRDTTTGNKNVAVGKNAGTSVETAAGCTYVGYEAGDATTTVGLNTYIGYQAGKATTQSPHHPAIGYRALASHAATAADGQEGNVAIGHLCMEDNTSGYANVAIGRLAMLNSVDGYANVCVGSRCGEDAFQSGNGNNNTFVGFNAAGGPVTSATHNVGVGMDSCEKLTTGDYNVAVGAQSAFDLTEGSGNVFLGYYSGSQCATGNHNVAIGNGAASVGIITGQGNTTVGQNSLNNVTSGNYNACLGKEAGHSLTEGSHAICVGYRAGKNQMTTTGDQLYIANGPFSAGNDNCFIYGNSLGELIQGSNSSSWYTTSDSRLKKNIVDNNVGLSIIDNIKVRNFEYKTEAEIDRSQFPKVSTDKFTKAEADEGEGTEGDYKQGLALNHPGTQLGVIAQELESITPNCVKTDHRDVKTVSTDDLFWHMLNAIKELSAKVKVLEAA